MEAFLKEFCEFKTEDAGVLKFQLQAQKLLTLQASRALITKSITPDGVTTTTIVRKKVTREEQAERRTQILKDFEDGVAVGDIARKHGMTYEATYMVLKRAGKKGQNEGSSSDA